MSAKLPNPPAAVTRPPPPPVPPEVRTHKHVAPGTLTVELATDGQYPQFFELGQDDVRWLDEFVALGIYGHSRAEVIKQIIRQVRYRSNG